MSDLGWTTVTRRLREDVSELQSFVTGLLVPEAREVIINFVREHPNCKTSDFNAFGKWKTRLYWSAWWKAQDQLKKEGVIVSTSHGRGKNRTWNLSVKEQFIIPDESVLESKTQ